MLTNIMKKRRELCLYFAILFLGIISVFYDAEIINFIIGFRNIYLTKFFLFISSNLFMGLAILLLPVILLWKKKRLATYHAVTFFLSLVISIILKEIVMRPRPEVMQLATETSYSFPSNHTILAFSVLPLLFQEKIGWPFLILAVLMGFSRIYLGVHYMSDVLLTALIGLIIGKFILKQVNIKNT